VSRPAGKNRRATLAVVALLASAGPVAAAGPVDGAGADGGGAAAVKPMRAAVSVTADRQEARLGEPILLTIEVQPAPGDSYRLPPTLKLDPFVELQRTEGLVGGGVQRILLKVATFEQTGPLSVPAIPLEPVPVDGGSPAALEVPAVKIQIQSMLSGLKDPGPRDVAGPQPVRVRDLRLLVYLGLAGIWLGLSLLLRWRRRPEAPAARLGELPPPRLAHEIALERLEQIVRDDLLRQGRTQEFFVRVSEAVREYLGNRYAFFALDLTTRELLEELRDRPTPGLEHNRLEQLLVDADLVKFAKVRPGDETCSRTLNGAFELVQATKFVPAPETEPRPQENG